MLAYVLNKYGKYLMPYRLVKVKKLLKAGKAKVVKVPFTVKLLYGFSGNVQPITVGMDSGSKIKGFATIGNGKVLYQSEQDCKLNIARKMLQRVIYRRTQRSRKTRYHKPRWKNRASMRTERFTPSIAVRFESHLCEKRFVNASLPVKNWKVKTASFAIHKIVNPSVSSRSYQNGAKKNFYNLKAAYVQNRDSYTCQSGRKCKRSVKLYVHHKAFRSRGANNSSSLMTTQQTCRNALHRTEFELRGNCSKTRHTTESDIVKTSLEKKWKFELTFFYKTKFKREQGLDLKTHYFDTVAIYCEEGAKIITPFNVGISEAARCKRRRPQTASKRSEKCIPMLFSLRKFDLICTDKGDRLY